MRRGLAASREAAQAAVATGRVVVGGAPAEKPARLVAPSEPIELLGPPRPFVSRAGEKLEAALDRFGVEVSGRSGIDAGSSTGGFVDCLLQRGVARVVAVDVGRGQLDSRIRQDPRVSVLEGVNVRHLTPDLLGGESFGIVTADLSFISLRTVAPVLAGEIAAPGSDLVALIKPQFEAGRREASRARGVITDPAVWRRVMEEVTESFREAGAGVLGAMPSPIRGARGNVEFFIHARPHVVGGRPTGARAARGQVPGELGGSSPRGGALREGFDLEAVIREATSVGGP